MSLCFEPVRSLTDAVFAENIHVVVEGDPFSKLIRDLEKEHKCQVGLLRGEIATLRQDVARLSQLRSLHDKKSDGTIAEIDLDLAGDLNMKSHIGDTSGDPGIEKNARPMLRTPLPTQADQWCPEPSDPDSSLDVELVPTPVRTDRKSVWTHGTSLDIMGPRHTNMSSAEAHRQLLLEMTTEADRKKVVGDGDSLHLLDAAFTVLIIANAIAMGWQVQRQAEIGREPTWAPPTNLCFTFVFVLELVLRGVLERGKFLRGKRWRWNLFDLIIVTLSVVEEILVRALDGGKLGGSTLRTLRLLRVIRIIRGIELVRFVRLFRTGRMLLLSLMEAFGMMMWICFVLISLVYMLALTLASAALPHCEGDTREYDALCDHFGSLFQSFATTFQAILGGIDWGALVDAVEVIDTFFPVLVATFTTYISCIFLPIVVSIFVVLVQKIDAKESEDTFFVDTWEKKERVIGKMMRIFRTLDVNESGALSRAELYSALKDKEMLGLLATLELDSDGIVGLFDLMDVDDSGQISMDEFIEGCSRVQGKARAVTVEKVERLVVQIEENVAEINRKIGKLGYVLELDIEASEKLQDVNDAFSTALSSPKRATSALGSLFPASPASSHIRSSRKACIEKTEMRAMRLEELEHVVDMIKLSCRVDAWSDMFSGEQLKPEQTNLYHFNYHCICPQTAGPTLLMGLADKEYSSGSLLTQMNPSNGSVLALGRIEEDTRGSEVVITLLKGKFMAALPGTNLTVSVFLDGEDCGTLAKVSTVNADDSMSFKEVLSSEPTKPDWFCCHWWGEPILDFVKCCQMHSQKRKRDCYWICAYANRQHELDTEICDDPENTSFRRAMRLSEGTLLVLDQEATPFERIWCDYELFKTLSEPGDVLFDIVTLEDTRTHLLTEKPLPGEPAVGKANRESTFPLRLLAKGIQVALENGNASVESDKDNILRSMAKHPITGEHSEESLQKHVDFANRTLRGHLAAAAWPQALKRGIVEHFASQQDGPSLGLPAVLADDAGRVSLSLSFASIEEVTDSEIILIALGLPTSLVTLSLSFEGCRNLGDVGISALAQRLASLSLQNLTLDFVGCTEVTDAGVTYLANGLPSTLIELRLDFAFCPKISRTGVVVLSKSIPANLKKLKATFKGTKCDMMFDSVRALKKAGQSKTGGRSSVFGDM